MSEKRSKKRNQRYSHLKHALEPRILFDASLVVSPHDLGITSDTSSHDATQSTSQQDTSQDTSHNTPAQVDAKTTAPADTQASTETASQPAQAELQDVSKTATSTRTGITDNSVDTQPLAVTDLPAKELVFIDYRVQDPQTLLNSFSPNVEVHYINADQDGVNQINQVINSENSPISTIHILSHGSTGTVDLGTSVLNEKTLNDNYAQEMVSWKTHLTADATILLYGCDIAQDASGKQFVDDLSRDTGARVGASTDSTGSAHLAGNWDIEFYSDGTGTAVTSSFNKDMLAGYDYLLGAATIDLNGPTVLNVADNFATGTYTGGTSNTPITWSGGWVEFDGSPNRAFNPSGSTNSDNSPTGGNVIIPNVASGGSVSGLGTGLEIAMVGHGTQYGDYIAREINLDAYTSATLSFSYRTAGLTSADAVRVDVSTDGGATFTTIGTLANVTSNTTLSFDISNYISETTVIKFAIDRGFSTASSQQFLFDNVSISADGNNYTTSFSEQAGTPVAIAGAAMTLTHPNNELIKTANVTLANFKTGDQFAIGSIPNTITANINNITGTVTLQSVSGSGASTADFVTAIKSITFANTSATADATTRIVNITATDASGLTSAPAVDYISIVPYDNPSVVASHSISASSLGTTSGSLFDSSSLAAEQTPSATMDYDPDTAGLHTTLLTQGSKGTAVVNADGTFTYTPNAGASGSDSFTYSLVSQAQVIGVNYQEWNMDTSNTSLINNFPTSAPSHTGFISGYNVDQVAIDSGNTTLDNFVVRFNNSITITTAGTYTFYAGSDDGSALYIDGQLVVNNDGLHSFIEQSNTVTLSAGTHSLQVDFFEKGGQELLYVSYLGPDTAGLKTNLSHVGSVLADSTTTGTVNVTIQSSGPALALGTNVNALDTFTTRAYSNNDGTFNWAGNWTELNDGTPSATGGQINVTTAGVLRVSDTSTSATTRSISRSIDLLALSGITPTRVGYQLSFDYNTPAASNGVYVQISSDGGASWTTIDTISSTGATGTTHKSYDISSYASSNVQVQFMPTSSRATAIVNFDNVRIDASTVNYTAANFIENGAPVAIASSGSVISDAATSTISSATISISNYQAGDLLSYDNFVAGISASFSGGTLTLAGAATQAQYATALQHVFYSSSSDNPSTVNRNINVAIKDSLNNFSNAAVTTIGVTAVNDAPVGIARTVSTSLNTSYVLQTSDFSFTDIEGDALQAVKISTVPASVGILQYDTTGSGSWTTVTSNQSITAADIAAGRLRFVPTTGASGPANFTFQVQDTGGTANGGVNTDPTAKAFTVNVLSGPNTAPTLTRDLTLVSSAEDNMSPTPRTITQLMTDGGPSAFSDPDANASLTGLAITGNTANSLTEGVWQYSTNGSNWYNVGTVGDNASTLALVLSASTQVRFVPVTNYNGNPPALTVRAIDDTFSGSFTNGATRATVNSGTNGGSSAISATTRNLNVTVTAVNDAPILTASGPIFNSINATQVNNSGQLVSDFVKGTSGGSWSYVTDVDAGAVQGVAIISAASTNGTWQYSTDNGATWTSVGTVSVNSSLLLRSTDKIRFNPDGVNAGTGAITYRAWDQSSGAVGTKVNTTNNGGITPFSVITDTASIMTSSASGPILANTSSPLNYIENSAAGAINTALTVTDISSGTLSSSQVAITNYVSGQDALSFTNNGSTMGNITASFNTTTGVLSLSSAGSTATLAQWQAALRAVKYSNSSDAPNVTSRAVNYQVNDSNGLASNVLTATLSITAVNDAPSGTNKTITLTQSSNYVISAADFGFTDPLDNPADSLIAVQITTLPTSGTLKNNGVTVTLNSYISIADINAGKLIYTSATTNASYTVKFKVQDSGGTANGGVDLDPTAKTLTFTVNATNTAPSLTVFAPTLTTITEKDINNTGQAVSSFLGTVTDPNTGALKGIAITSLGTATNGSWQYSLDNGATWITFPTIATSTSLLLRSTDTVRFVPNAVNGGGGTFTYRAWDQTTGTAGTTANTSTTGGSTAYSTNTATATITSTAVNDAPTATITPTSYSAIEQTNLTLSGTGISIGDIDAGSSNLTATFSVGEGVLTAAAGTTGVSISGSGTSTITLTGTITQINNLLTGSNGGSFTYNDPSDSPASTTNLTMTVNDLGNTGTGGALSTSIVRAINITAVNDAPTLTTTGTIGGSYTENGTGIAVVTGTITAGDIDTSNFNNGSVTAKFTSYVTGDVLKVINQGVGAGQIGVSGANITYAGTIIGTYTGGTAADLVITLNSNATSTAVQALVSQLQYSSTSQDPTFGGASPTRAVSVILNDGGNTGTGGPLTATLAGTVTITAIDTAPTVSVTATGGTFVEGAGISTGTAVSFFSNAAVSAIESGQTIKSLTFTVNNISDSTEQINIDGSVINLTNGSGTTATNTISYNVTVNSGVATVTLSKTAGVSSSIMNNLINGLSYQNTSQNPTEASRTLTLTQIVDSGSGTLPNANTTALSLASVVTVQGVPETPTILSVPENAGGGINAAEATSGGGTIVNVGLPIDAKTGDTLTINWGSQTVNYTLLAGDITATNAAVLIPTSVISTQGDGTFNITAKVTHLTRTGLSSTPVSITVDTIAPTAPVVGLTTDSGTSGSDKITNIGTLSVSGTESGATIQYSSDNVTWGSTAPALTQGANTVYVRQTDVAGNISAATAYTFTYDTVVAAPTVALTTDTGSSGSDKITNVGTLNVTGTESGALIEYSSNGTTWTGTAPTLTQGANTVYVRETDVAGNVSTPTTFTFTYDTVAPAAGTLSLNNFTDTGISASDFISQDNTFDLTLAGNEAGSTVVYQKSTDNGVTWTTTTTAQTSLTDGIYKFRTSVTDAAGNNAIGNVITVTIDTAAPAAGTLSLANFIDSGVSATDFISNDKTFDLSLAGNEAGSTVIYQKSIDNGVTWSTTTAAQTNLTDGLYKFRTSVTDTAGNNATSNIITVTVDTTATAGTLSLNNFSDTGVSASDFISQDNTFDLTLAGNEAGSTVVYQVSIDNGVNWVNTTANRSNLTDGDYQFRTQVTDVAGNIAYSNLINVTVDTTAPAAGTLSLNNFSDSGISATDFISQDKTFDLSVAGNEVGSSIVYQVSVDNGANWTDTTAAQSNLNDGDYQFRTQVTDVAGNIAYSNLINVTVDTTAPAAGTLSLNNFSDSGISATDFISQDKAFDLSIAGNEVGSSVVYQISTDNGANWSDTTAAQSNLSDGNYQFRTQVTDVAGNIAYSNLINVTVDTTSPAAGTLSLNNFSDSGISATDFISQDKAFDLSIAGNEVGSSVVYQISTDNGANWSDTTAAQSNLADGDYQFRTQVTDVAGNIAYSNLINVTVDTTAPAAGTLSLNNFSDSGISATDFISQDKAFDLSIAGNEVGSSVVYQVSTDNGANWTDTTAAQSNLVDGDYQFRTQVTDVAGNIAYSNLINVTVDTTAPAAGTLSLNNFSDSGISATDFISQDKTFDLSVAGNEVGSSIVYQVSVDNGANWSDTTAAQSNLSDGDYQFRTQVTDVAGNIAYSNLINVTVDTTAPAAGTLSLNNFSDSGISATDFISQDKTFDLSVAGNEVGSSVVYQVSVDNGANWSDTTAAQSNLVDGDYQFRTQVTDVAGNIAYSNLINVTVDTTAPAAGTLSLNNFSDSGISATDFISQDKTFDLSVAGNEVGSSVVYQVSVDNGANWSDTTAAQSNLVDGDYQFRTQVTDVAGNIAYSNLINVTVDTTAPAAGTLSLNNFSDSGISATDFISQDKTFDLSIAGNEVGSSVVYQVSTDNGANWSDTTAAQSNLNDGDYQFRTQVTDVAGNIAYSNLINVTVDTTSPAAGTLSLNNFSDSGISATDFISQDKTFDLSVAGNEVGSSVVYQVSVDNGANWTDTTAAQSNLVDGDYQFRTQVTDVAGNIAYSNLINVTVDTTAPAAGTLSLNNFSDSGISATDFISQDKTFDLSVAGNEVGSSVVYQVSVDNGANWSDTTAAQNNLVDGDYQFRTQVTDVAGNIAYSNLINVTVDTTAPAAGTLSLNNFSDSGISATDFISQDKTFDLSVAGNEVGSSVVYQVSVDNGANWSDTTAAQSNLVDGDYQFRTQVTDVAGNIAYSNLINVTVDTTAPAAGTLSLNNFSDSGISATDFISQDKTFDLSVAGNEVGSSVVYQVSVDNGANWTDTTAAQSNLSDGDYQFRTQVTDVAGNIAYSNLINVTVDTTAPAAGTLSLNNFSDSGISATDFISQDKSFDLSIAGNEVGSSIVYQVSVDNGANWTDTTAAQSNLVDGDYQFRTQVTDVAGNIAYSNLINVTVDTTAPSAGTLSLNNFSDSGISATDFISQDKAFDLSIAGNEVGSSVVYQVSVDNGANWTDTTAAQSNLVDGDYQFRTQVTDVAGNIAYSNLINVTVDTTAPAAGTLSLNNFSDSGISATDFISQDKAFDLSIAGNEVGSSVVYQVSVDNGANWTDTTAAQSNLSDGNYQFRTQVTDVAGNIAYSNLINVTVDTTAPSAGTLSLNNFSDSGISATDFISQDKAFDLSIAGNEVGSSVVYQVSVDNGANWSDTTAAQSNLSDGNYQFRTQVTDVAGNIAYSNLINVTVDTTAPAAGTLSLNNFSDSGISATDFISQDKTFDLSVAGNEVGSSVVYQVSTDSGANWTDTTAAQSNLNDGDYQFRTQVTDVAGNIAYSNLINVTVDTTSPAAGTLSLNNFSDSGISATDFISQDKTFDLSVAGNEVGSSVVYQVSTDNGANWTDTTAAQSNLVDGDYQFRTQVTDVAGNIAYSNLINVTVDTTAPAAGTLSLNNFSDSGISATDFISQDKAFDLSIAGNEVDSSIVYQVSVDNGANWTDTTAAQSNLNDGDYQFRTQVTDVAGNIAYSNLINVTVDTTAPAAGTLSLNNFSDSGISATDFISQDKAFDLSIAGNEVGSSIVYQVSVDNGANWTDTTAAQSNLSDGNYQFRTQVTDVAGNIAYSNLINVTVDTTAPAAGTLITQQFQ